MKWRKNEEENVSTVNSLIVIGVTFVWGMSWFKNWSPAIQTEEKRVIIKISSLPSCLLLNNKRIDLMLFFILVYTLMQNEERERKSVTVACVNGLPAFCFHYFENVHHRSFHTTTLYPINNYINSLIEFSVFVELCKNEKRARSPLGIM